MWDRKYACNLKGWKMVRAVSVVALVMALGACSENYGGATGGMDGYAREEMQSATAPAAAPDISFETPAPADMDSPIVQPEPGGGSGGAEPGTAPLMAYTYNWNFAVPTEGMQGLQNAHKKLCEEAGPANCYVTNSYLNAIGRKEGANGSLSMRATEAWVRKFETGVDAGLKQFGASVYSTNRAAEELTAQIVDTEARLNSMRAHRDALQKMLADRPGKLSDLLEIQQALDRCAVVRGGGVAAAGVDVGADLHLPGRVCGGGAVDLAASDGCVRGLCPVLCRDDCRADPVRGGHPAAGDQCRAVGPGGHGVLPAVRNEGIPAAAGGGSPRKGHI
jgi:hypothetical protein